MKNLCKAQRNLHNIIFDSMQSAAQQTQCDVEIYVKRTVGYY